MYHRSFLIAFCLLSFCAACGESDNSPAVLPYNPTTIDAADDATGTEDSQEAHQESKPLRIVTWNTHLFHDSTRGNCENCWVDEPVVSASAYQQKLEGIAEGLAELKGDIVILQELENEKILDALASSSKLDLLGYEHRKLDVTNDPTGLNIAVLSRIPIDKTVSHVDERFSRLDDPGTMDDYTRDAFEVHLTFQEQHVVILGVHFKAKANDNPDLRIAEAQHTRLLADRLLEATPSLYLVIAGDFNDTPGSTAYNSARDGLAGPVFLHPAAELPESQRYTFEYSGEHQFIDHMLACPTMGDRLDPDQTKILHDASLPSDHAPIAATYMIP